MKISDIHYGTNDINITAKVVEVGDAREVKTRFGQTLVCNATVEDETGQIKLTLWGKQIDNVKKGSTVVIEKGYVREFGGDIFVNVGRNGKLEIQQ